MIGWLFPCSENVAILVSFGAFSRFLRWRKIRPCCFMSVYANAVFFINKKHYSVNHAVLTLCVVRCVVIFWKMLKNFGFVFVSVGVYVQRRICVFVA